MSKPQYKLLLLLFIGVIFYLTLTGWYKETLGYYGFQDSVRYEKWVRDGHYDFTHWVTIVLLQIMGVQPFAILLFFVAIPYSLYLYYKSWDKVFNFYFYSPFLAFLFVENVYSQLLSFLFFILYLARKKTVYEVVSIICHPVFTIMFIVQHTIDRQYRKVCFFLIVGVVIYSSGVYGGHNLFNMAGENEVDVFNVFLYLNPFNLLSMPRTLSFFSFNFLALILHNGRFIMYGLLQQYHNTPGGLAKIWGVFINFLLVYMLVTKI